MRQLKKGGMYFIKDEFFELMNDPYLKSNKHCKRPHYYCLQDQEDGIYWMIPLSSRVEKYRRIIQKREEEGKPCDILHIAMIKDNEESAFLIQDMFPITKQYIYRPYTFKGKLVELTNDIDVEQIEQKARVIMELLKDGVRYMPTQIDVIAILEKLNVRQ